MGIPLQFTSEAKIPNLNELQQNLQLRGGFVIQYQQMHSLILASHTAPHFEWMESDADRRKVGLRYAGHNMLFGWWSVFGLIGNLSILLTNLLGGIDVTPMFRAEPLAEAETNRLSVEKMLREQAKQQRRFKVCFWISLVGYIILAFMIATSDWASKRGA